MSELETLLRELKILQRIQADLTQLSSRQDAARKAETVNLRRALALQLGVLAELGRTTLSGASDRQLSEDYRTRLSAMRSAIAVHQAAWPAVALDDAPGEYLQSAKRVLKATQEFTPWAIEAVSARIGGEGPKT